MRIAWMIIVALVVTFSVSPLRAQDAAPAQTEATASEVLAALKEAKTDPLLVLKQEATLGPATVGYSSASLSAAQSDAAAALLYNSESVIIMPDTTRLELQLHARLTQRFEPMEIEFRRDVIGPDGKRQSTIERAEISATEVVLSRIDGGDPVTKRSVSRPESPFVFGIEFLVQRIDAKRFPSFVIQELSPQKGTLIAHHFMSGTEPKGGYRLVSRKADLSPGYSFQLDSNGAMVSWGEPPVPLVFKVCGSERFEEVKNLFKK